jgi:hypothetical protein
VNFHDDYAGPGTADQLILTGRGCCEMAGLKYLSCRKNTFMKSSLLAFAALIAFSLTAVAQEKKESLWMNQTTHDFGKIPQGKPVFTYFELKGIGDSLKLEAVQAGCGCTTPEFQAGTYAPGVPVKIKVGFNASAAGPFNKPVTITYNDGQQKVITITGNVESTPSTPAPGSAAGKMKQ